MTDTTNAVPGPDSARLRRMTKGLYRATGVLMIAFPLAVIVAFALADDATLVEQVHLHSRDLRSSLALWQRVAAGILSLLALSMLLRAFHHARHCFLQMSQGLYFEIDVVRRLRAVALWGCVFSAASFLVRGLLSVLLTLRNPPGARMLALGIDGGQLITLFFAGLIWAISAVLAEACSIARENSQFV
jgi:hypothetical protein